MVASVSDSTREDVLIVDDDEDIRDLLREILESRGYLIGTAENGVDAIDHIRIHHPRVVLLDMMMPVMDGFAFLREREYDQELLSTPVIIASANLDLMRMNGVTDGIPRMAKPFDLDQLTALIDRVIGR